MKRNLIATLSLALLSLTAVGAYAQAPVQATVPFAFRVGTAHLPAGTYRISHQVGSSLVMLTNAKDGHSAIALSGPAPDSKAARKLVFLHVGSQYALTRIWGEPGTQGMTFRAPKMDTEKVAALAPSHAGNEVEIALK